MNKLPDPTTLQERKKQIAISQTQQGDRIPSIYRPLGTWECLGWGAAELSQKGSTPALPATPQSPAWFQRRHDHPRIARFSACSRLPPCNLTKTRGGNPGRQTQSHRQTLQNTHSIHRAWQPAGAQPLGQADRWDWSRIKPFGDVRSCVQNQHRETRRHIPMFQHNTGDLCTGRVG